METIKSFTVDHKRLLPGVYVSRKDSTGHDVVTTFDIRMTRPNFEPVMNTAEIHTLEHLGATFLRNHEEWGDKIIYFGPMAVPVFIFCLPVTMNRKILSHCFVKCLSLSVILRARFRVQHRRRVAII